MGLISAFMGMHIAIIEAITVFSGSWFFSYTNYGKDTINIIMALVLILSVINIIGAFLIRQHRIAGGVVMLSASLPVFIVSVIDPDLMFIFAPTSFVGIIAAIIAFIPLSDRFIAAHIEKVRFHENMNAYFNSQIPYQQTAAVPQQAETPAADQPPHADSSPARQHRLVNQLQKPAIMQAFYILSASLFKTLYYLK